MNRRFARFTFLLLLISAIRLPATHIAGAELSYECLGNNLYRIQLTFFRDCLNAQPGAIFDDPLELWIFESATGNVYATQQVSAPLFTPRIEPDNWDACLATLPQVCVEEGIYETTIQLPALAGGYDIGWSRCCRNNIIDNLSAPVCEGVTFLARVPGPAEAVCNSMPTFNQRPSLYLCAGQTYFFDHSATDLDGDSLVYEVSNPYTGINTNGLGTGNPTGACGPFQPNPVLDQFGNPMGPPPYLNVNFSPGYSALNPFGPGSSLTINPTTGFLEAFPANPGVYVFAISVKEYRNGSLLSENKRDFQFYVLPCLSPGPPPVITHDLSGLNTSSDTIFADAGQSFCYNFSVTDAFTPSTLVVTPISVSFGGNGGFPPPYATVSTTGDSPPVQGQICWSPACDYAGGVVPMIISVRDTNDCPNYNIVFDTVWVQVIPPAPAPPIVQNNLQNAPQTNGDTIIVNVGDQFCYNFTVADTQGSGSLSGTVALLNSPGVTTLPTLTTLTNPAGDSLYGEVCWEGLCDSTTLYTIVTYGIDAFQCPPDNQSTDTTWVRVVLPNNPSPTLNVDASQNPNQNNDTIIARVHEAFCFEFTLQDTSLLYGDSIAFQFFLRDLQGGGVPGETPTYAATGSLDSIGGEICWTPRCLNVEQVFRFELVGIQINECGFQAFDRDTVYVRVIEPFKPVPLISHDLGPAFPDNQNLSVADGDTFCFEFTLRDTVTPTQLAYSVEVVDLSGVAIPVAAPPVLNYGTFQDNLLEGTICWTVPCDLYEQTFRLRMTGRDTFDCRVSNLVYDSITVTHVDNPPQAINFCRVSVAPGDAAIELVWEPGPDSDGQGYVIERRREDETSFSGLDTITNYADSSYVDGNFVAADDFGYCYRIRAFDRCGVSSAVSSEMCTILLQGEPNDYISEIQWTPYRGWAFGVDEYELYRNDPEDPTPEALLASLGPNAYAYLDRDIVFARTCYRVRAVEFSGSCGQESWSNEICLDFPPTLYVPSAFTPNGDGLNDNFTSAGEFSQFFELTIYDRWGKVLFVSRDVATGWDGNINGQAAPEGVYIFNMVVVGFDGQTLRRKGSVTLLR
ncbi:MAG: gliding motility-associated C-terminal domain-containing protein [Bacteroidota bacterium]